MRQIDVSTLTAAEKAAHFFTTMNYVSFFDVLRATPNNIEEARTLRQSIQSAAKYFMCRHQLANLQRLALIVNPTHPCHRALMRTIQKHNTNPDHFSHYTVRTVPKRTALVVCLNKMGDAQAYGGQEAKFKQVNQLIGYWYATTPKVAPRSTRALQLIFTKLAASAPKPFRTAAELGLRKATATLSYHKNNKPSQKGP